MFVSILTQQNCKLHISVLSWTWQIPQDKVDQIGGLKASEVIAKIKSKELTPEEVLECYQYKVILGQGGGVRWYSKMKWRELEYSDFFCNFSFLALISEIN